MLFTSDVSGITTVSGTIRARIVAHGFRDVQPFIYLRQAQAAILGVTSEPEQQNTIEQEQRIIDQSSSPELDWDVGAKSLSRQRADSKPRLRKVITIGGI